jgi:predicted RNA-binding protein YlxR (DUF448 family)
VTRVRRGHVPLRTCAGCRAVAPRSELLRIVRSPDGSVDVDPAGGQPGRGAYVHPTAACIEAAVPRGVARALRTGIGVEGASRLMDRLFEVRERT